jgi:hypothetical protein
MSETERAPGRSTRRPSVPPPARAAVSLAPVIDRLAEYARLPANWDSYGSPPVSGVALAEALRLLVMAQDRLATAGQGIVPYHTAPVPGGGVQLEWRGRDAGLEVLVGDDGALGALLIEPTEAGEQYAERPKIGHADALVLLARVLGVSS